MENMTVLGQDQNQDISVALVVCLLYLFFCIVFIKWLPVENIFVISFDITVVRPSVHLIQFK